MARFGGKAGRKDTKKSQQLQGDLAMTMITSTRFNVQLQRVRGLAAGVCLALTAAGTAAAEPTVAHSAVQHISSVGYLGTGLVSSAPWLLSSTPDPATFTLLGIGFIGVALLGRKKLAR